MFYLRFTDSLRAQQDAQHGHSQRTSVACRWYYLADKLGMLVWQDMPAMCGMWEMPGAVGEWYFDGCWVTTVYALLPRALSKSSN